MIDWETVGPVLIGVLSRLADLPTRSPARWVDEKGPFIDPRQKGEVLLRIVSDVDVGEGPETRHVRDEGGQDYEIFVGHRAVQLEVQVSSHDHSYRMWCRTTADRIRTYLNRSSVQAELLAANVGVSDVGSARDFSFLRDGRTVNAVVFELALLIAFQTTPTADDAVGRIEHVRVSSRLRGPNGELLSEPPNFTDQLMP